MNRREQKTTTGSNPCEDHEILVNGTLVRVNDLDLQRYSKPLPRYTSYPTALQWHDRPADNELASRFGGTSERASRPLSIYVHIPFCRSLCLFCGCNVVITRDPTAGDRYLDYLEREFDGVAREIRGPGRVEQLHIGGGTPTSLNSDQLRRLDRIVRERFEFATEAELSIEVEPRTTSPEDIHLLRELGFNRLSMGIQDFDPVVQRTVRREHSFDVVNSLVRAGRRAGYESINVDLIYGLPHQTIDGYRATLTSVSELDPDRIALFSYAHVPWIKKQQGALRHNLPGTMEKFRILAMAVQELTRHGYRHIGMDHFVKPTDELSVAYDDGTLHRNFQGYTTRKGCDLLGFGVSAIGDLDDLYLQNERSLSDYYAAIDAGRPPVARCCRLTDEDRIRREIIEAIMCRGEVDFSDYAEVLEEPFQDHFAPELERIRRLQDEQLVELRSNSLLLTPRGRLFVRNVAAEFDAYLPEAAGAGTAYSSAV